MGSEDKAVVGAIGTVPVCQACGSERIVRDAWACWNPESGLWELETVFDQTFCRRCDGETTFRWQRAEAVPRQRVRELNDRLRRDGQGRGSVMVTVGLRQRGTDFMLRAVATVRAFDAFTEDNDPWGEHDFGAVEVDGEKVFWKIDYFTPDLTAGSANPANEGETHRVLTIMLAREY